MRRHYFRIYLSVCITVSVILRAGVPINPAYGMVHDDELMVELARQILDGNWLGDYSKLGHLTLAKAAGFPLFLAAARLFPWSPVMTVHLILVMGIIIITRELRMSGLGRGPVAFLFSLFVFFPNFYSEEMSRIYREGLLTALIVVIVGLSLTSHRLLTGVNSQGSGEVDSGRLQWRTATCIVGLGLALGSFVIVKPSWHASAVLVVIILGTAILRRSTCVKKRLVVGMTAGVLLGVSALLPVGLVIWQNYHHYEVAITDSFSQGSFPRVLREWYGVYDSLDRDYVDINREMRDVVYQISPTALSMKPYLERPVGEGWRSHMCNSIMKICDESAAFFQWELRDAVQLSGQGDTAAEFEMTLKKIADDIQGACEQRTIRCETQGIAPGVDSFDSLGEKHLFEAAARATRMLLNPNLGYVSRGPTPEEVLNPQRKALWNSTVRGLPPNWPSSNYEANDVYLGDVRLLLADLYTSIWTPLLIVSLVGLVLPKRYDNLETDTKLRILGLACLCAAFVYVVSLSLLEASSGFFITAGGPTYLQPVFPLLLCVVMAGIARVAISFTGPGLPRISNSL